MVCDFKVIIMCKHLHIGILCYVYYENINVFFIAITCSRSLSTPSYGFGPDCNNGNNYASSCTFSCGVGFVLSSNTAITCDGNGDSTEGEWSSEEPTCTSEYCI